MAVRRKEELVMYTAGQKPGIGKYTCTQRGATVRLDNATDLLSPCSNCNNTSFAKNGDTKKIDPIIDILPPNTKSNPTSFDKCGNKGQINPTIDILPPNPNSKNKHLT